MLDQGWNGVTADLAKLPNVMVSSNMTTRRLYSSVQVLGGLLALLAIPSTARAQTGNARTAVPRSSGQASAASTTPGAVAKPAALPLTGTLGPDAARALRGMQSAGAPGVLSGASHGLPTGMPEFVSEKGRRRRPLPVGVYVPLVVTDAPASGRGSLTLEVGPTSSEEVIAPSFYSTMEPPSWRIVPEEHPVQGWRVVDVTDVICDVSGRCAPTVTRMLARWAPSLRGYAFRDRVGRIWRVE